MKMEEVRRPVLVTIGEQAKPLVDYIALGFLGFKLEPIIGKNYAHKIYRKGEIKWNI